MTCCEAEPRKEEEEGLHNVGRIINSTVGRMLQLTHSSTWKTNFFNSPKIDTTLYFEGLELLITACDTPFVSNESVEK